MVSQQPVDPGRAIWSIVTPIGVQEDRSCRVGTVAIAANTELPEGRFHDRQRITAPAPADVQMHRNIGFLGKEANERRVPDFAFAFAAHKDAPALRAMAISSPH